MAQFPKHIFFETPALPGAGFVLSTQQPFIVAKVYKFKTAEEVQQMVDAGHGWSAVKIARYRIALTYFKSLASMGALTQANKLTVHDALQEMADFYLTEKIQPHAAAYTKYKEQ